MRITTNSNEETITLGKKIGELLKKGDTIFLSGDLGAGKTTFTKGIGLALDVKRVINSPTFTLVKVYQGKYKLNHLDLYRIEDLDNFEVDEYFNDDDIIVCEWPKNELIHLKDEYLQINIYNKDNNSREFELKPVGKHYEEIVEAL